jgi:riboflavin kinase/FMN adenylyltransferase
MRERPPFRRLFGCDDVPDDLRGAVVAIGNFDGVHRGHQALLTAALDEARRIGKPAAVLTFEPHPRAFFRPGTALPRITSPAMRARLIDLLGFDAVVEQPFDRAFADRSADSFVHDILVERLGVSCVVTGFDFHFGRGRQGNPDFLAEAGSRCGFPVVHVPPFSDEGGDVVSSSRIRTLLCDGDVSQAAGLLGYRFTIEGEIVHGQKLGRTIGYPTANMVVPDGIVLRHGVYAVRMRRHDGSLYDGVASFGIRPTVTDAGAPLLETYLFDFLGDLYGEICDVSFFGFLRPEERFDGLDAMLAQIRRDEHEARAMLTSVRPLGHLDARLAF